LKIWVGGREVGKTPSLPDLPDPRSDSKLRTIPDPDRLPLLLLPVLSVELDLAPQHETSCDSEITTKEDFDH